jgi:hypothetical protein
MSRYSFYHWHLSWFLSLWLINAIIHYVLTLFIFIKFIFLITNTTIFSQMVMYGKIHLFCSYVLDTINAPPSLNLMMYVHGTISNFQFQLIIHNIMLNMSSQACSYQISLLAISIRLFVWHSFQSYAFCPVPLDILMKSPCLLYMFFPFFS